MPMAYICYEVMNNKLGRLLKEGIVAYFISIIPSFARLRNLPNIKQEISTASFY